jgi:DNA recombination protein RmuC
MPDWLLPMLVPAAAALAAGLLVAALFAARRPRDGTGEALAMLAGKLEAVAATQERLAAATAERLRAQERLLADRLDHAAQRTQATAAQIHERLAVIDSARVNIEALGAQVGTLEKILGNKQARGAFGEVQLRELIEDRLPPGGFAWQHGLANGTRCDCLVRLPHPPGPIVVDSKFPLEAWNALRAAAEPDRPAAARRFAADVRRHVDAIATKYICPGETADGALMFVPSEAICAALHAEHPALVTEAARRGVWIVSPNAMWAVLTTMRGLMRDLRLKAEAHRIRVEVDRLMEEIGRLDRRVGALRGHFAQMQQDVAEIETTSAKIVRRGQTIQLVELPEDAAAPARAAE